MHPYEKGILEFSSQLSLSPLTSERLSSLSKKPYDGIIICGMGGSALAGGILQMTGKEIGLALPVHVWRDYDLPPIERTGFKNPLYIFSSFSGNTEETISGLRAALRKNGKGRVAAITSGGALRRIAKKQNLALVTFAPSPALQPRQGTGYMYYSLLSVLRGAGLIARIPEHSRLNPMRFKAQGLALAKKLQKRILTVYTPTSSLPLAELWKSKLSENAKVFAFPQAVPEMNHVELVSYEGKFKPLMASLFLTDNTMHPRTKKRFSIMKKMIQSPKVRVLEIPLIGKSKLEKAWNTSLLADWTGFSLAKLYGIDAAAIESVNAFKAQMKK